MGVARIVARAESRVVVQQHNRVQQSGRVVEAIGSGDSVRLKLAFCTTCAVHVLVLAQGPSF